MIVKTNGLVLHKIKYAENAAIVTVLTEKYGLKKFIARQIQAKKNAKAAYYQIGNILEIVFYNQGGKDLLNVKEEKCLNLRSALLLSPVDNQLLQFFCEIILNVSAEHFQDKEIYTFCIEFLDQFNQFHKLSVCHYFILELLQRTGHSILVRNNMHLPLDIERALWEERKQSTIRPEEEMRYFLPSEIRECFFIIENPRIPINLSRNEMKSLLKKLVYFLEIHACHQRKVKSFVVLQSLFE